MTHGKLGVGDSGPRHSCVMGGAGRWVPLGGEGASTHGHVLLLWVVMTGSGYPQGMFSQRS